MPPSVMTHTLSKLESGDLATCEKIIESGLRTFEDVGNALATIREKKLYRAAHPTFEAYCKERWGFTSSRARQLVAAAEVVKEFPQVTNERQARVVVSVPEDKREEVVQIAVEIAGSNKPSANDFEQARERVIPAKTTTGPTTTTAGNANFEDARTSFSTVSKQLALVNEMIEVLMESPHAAFLVAGEVRADLKNLRNMVKFAQPHSACPKCKAKGCDVCRQQGWVSVGVARHLTKEGE